MPRYADQKGADLHGARPGAGLLRRRHRPAQHLARRSCRPPGRLAAARQGERSRQQPKGTSDLRLAAAAALGLVFVVGLIGRVPFWLASAIFVAMFTVLFEWQPGQPWPVRARRVGEAVLLGLATGVAVTLVFEKVFYVRLP